VSLGVLPPPSRHNAPLWIVFCAGLAFLVGGVAVLAPVLAGETAPKGELRAGAPRWLRLLQYLLRLMAVFCLAAIATWIAFGAGTRGFNVSGPFFKVSGGAETLGRVVFGIGAIVTWLGFIALAISGGRKIFRGKA
jgi:hypothetical protein